MWWWEGLRWRKWWARLQWYFFIEVINLNPFSLTAIIINRFTTFIVVPAAVDFIKQTGTTCSPMHGNYPTEDEAFTACHFDPNCKGVANLYCDENVLAKKYHLCLATSKPVASSGCFWEKRSNNRIKMTFYVFLFVHYPNKNCIIIIYLISKSNCPTANDTNKS